MGGHKEGSIDFHLEQAIKLSAAEHVVRLLVAMHPDQERVEGTLRLYRLDLQKKRAAKEDTRLIEAVVTLIEAGLAVELVSPHSIGPTG